MVRKYVWMLKAHEGRRAAVSGDLIVPMDLDVRRPQTNSTLQTWI